MASDIPAVKAKDEDFSQHGKMRSLHHHSLKSCKEKGFLPTGIKNVDLLEKVGALKTEKLPRQTARDKLEGKNSVAPPFWTSQKPWPGRKAACIDEPVKNMSTVPCYLHRTDRGDNVHEKALNFGVLEWGLLERWAYHQNCATDVRGGEYYSRTIPSSLSRGKISHSGLPQKKRSAVSNTTKTCARENSKDTEGFRDSGIAFTKFPSQHDKQPDADFCLSADILGHKHSKGCSRSSDMKAVTREVDLAPHSAASPSRYKIKDAGTSRVIENQNSSLAKVEMSDDYPDRAEMANALPRFSQDSQVRWEYLRGSVDSVCPIPHFLFTTDGQLDERNYNNLSCNLAKDFDVIHQYPHVPHSHSCPFPCATMSDETDTSSTLPSETVVQREKSMTDELFSRGPSKKRENSTVQDLIKYKANATTATGKKSSDHASYAGLKRMNASCILKVGSSEEQCESISCLYNSNGDQANRNSKSRQSPLRRLLDPLLKPKNNPAVPSRHSCELGGTCKSSDGLRKLSISSDSTCPVRRSMETPKQSLQNGKGMQQDGRHVAQMNQAILQLAWKNGLPLFMLSSRGNEVLAAMITVRSISSNDYLDYRIFSLKDSKKKSKFWSSPGNKSKNHQLISNVVGQLKVSLRKLKSYEYDNSHDVREFVLLGAELAPTPQKPIDLPLKSELAAVVLKLPPHEPKSLNIGMFHNSKYRDSLPTNSVDLSVPNEDDDAERCITVILPGGVHGSSTDGEPSPLIQRWRSGGTCDCGGWDEGCKLTILSEKSQEYNTFGSPQDCQNTYRTCRFELFVKDGLQEKAFSMVPFREGQYAVNFLPSISLLQAFAICIAILHGRKPSNHSAEPKSLHEHIVDNQLGRAPAETPGDSTSYVPNHPPLSPVGRA